MTAAHPGCAFAAPERRIEIRYASTRMKVAIEATPTMTNVMPNPLSRQMSSD